jgi:hypothetical protein
MEMLDIPFCFRYRGTVNLQSSFFYPYGAHGPVFRRAPTHNTLRFQAQGISPIQSGIKTLPFFLSVVVCEYGLLFTRKLIT